MNSAAMVDLYRLYIDCILTRCQPPEGIELAAADCAQTFDRRQVSESFLDEEPSDQLVEYRILANSLETCTPPEDAALVANAVDDYARHSNDVGLGEGEQSPPVTATLGWIFRQWKLWQDGNGAAPC